MAQHTKQIHGESELAKELSNAGGKLVVVDFYADWYVFDVNYGIIENYIIFVPAVECS
jgi:hypothetical protein